MIKMRIVATAAILGMAFTAAGQEKSPASGKVPKMTPIPPAQFDTLSKTIQPYSGEFAWRDEVPWLTSLHEARVKASAENKPILLSLTAGGSILTNT